MCIDEIYCQRYPLLFLQNNFVVFRKTIPSSFLISQGTKVLLFLRFILGTMRTHIVMTDGWIKYRYCFGYKGKEIFCLLSHTLMLKEKTLCNWMSLVLLLVLFVVFPFCYIYNFVISGIMNLYHLSHGEMLCWHDPLFILLSACCVYVNGIAVVSKICWYWIQTFT